MNIYRRSKGAPYWYRFKFKGQLIRRSSGVFNKADAYDIGAAYRTQLARGEVGLAPPEPPPEIPSFDKAMVGFLEWCEQEYAVHPSSHKRYITSSKALLSYFGTRPIDKIESDDVEKFKLWRSKQKKSPQGKPGKHRKVTKQIRPATVNRELALLKHFYTRNENLIPQNPVSRVTFLAEDNEQFRVLSGDEENLYLMAASQPLQDVARMMIETGMRPEEVCRIHRQNVHLEQGYVFNPFGKTKAARRKVWLNPAASEVISRRLASAKGDYLFPGRVEGRPLVKCNAAHVSAVKRCGVKPFRLYDLRHTWATRAAESGVDIVTLATMLGHSKLAMVMRYVHPGEEHQAAAMRKIQAARQTA
jgi:integrase